MASDPSAPAPWGVLLHLAVPSSDCHKKPRMRRLTPPCSWAQPDLETPQTASSTSTYHRGEASGGKDSLGCSSVQPMCHVIICPS